MSFLRVSSFLHHQPDDEEDTMILTHQFQSVQLPLARPIINRSWYDTFIGITSTPFG